MTDTENSTVQMDEDSSLRTLAISHPLEPDVEEHVTKKPRVARNVLRIRGEDELKFDVNEEDWPNADLVWKTGATSVCARVKRNTSRISCGRPAYLCKTCNIGQKPEALDPRVLVMCFGFEYCSIQESGRTGFAVRNTAKYVGECLDLVQVQNAKTCCGVIVTEQKSAHLQDETTACDQVQHALFRAIVRILQYISGVNGIVCL